MGGELEPMHSPESRRICPLGWLQSGSISGTKWNLLFTTEGRQKENKSLSVGGRLIFSDRRELMSKSDSDYSRKLAETTGQDGSVTTATSKPPADTLDAWFERAQKARERMATDEEYRKEVAKGIS